MTWPVFLLAFFVTGQRIDRWVEESSVRAELSRFPSKEVVAWAQEVNRQHDEWIVSQMLQCSAECPWRWSDLETWRMENDRLFNAWGSLGFAHIPRHRWNDLHNLRERIGDAHYFTGTMPPPVPIWRFRQE